MFIHFLIAYLLIGVITLISMAYDPFSKSFDFGLSDGWEFFWFQRYVLWLIVIVGCLYYFPKEMYTKITERKYVKEWRTKGSFIRKL